MKNLLVKGLRRPSSLFYTYDEHDRQASYTGIEFLHSYDAHGGQASGTAIELIPLI